MNNNLSFILFITIAIAIYNLLNYYFIVKQKNLIKLKAFPLFIFRLVLFTVILAPIASMIFSRYGLLSLAAITGFIGYSWLAFLFLFVFIHLSADLILFIMEKTGFVPPAYTAKFIAFLTVIICFSILNYGRYEAHFIKTENIAIKTNKLPQTINKIKIAQISDVHFSALTGIKTAKKISDIIKKENPDILISTGDFLDKGIKNPEQITKIFDSLKPKMGKYAITGNHEFITGIDESVKFINDSGFVLLRNKATVVNNMINLVGIDDDLGKYYNSKNTILENNILSEIDKNKFTILLKHRPVIIKENAGLFDLQLSGHTHAGQIFPFSLLVKLVFPYIAGYYQIDENTMLYVSRGSGTWGPPFRFLAPPEITFFELINVKNS